MSNEQIKALTGLCSALNVCLEMAVFDTAASTQIKKDITVVEQLVEDEKKQQKK